MLFSVVSACAGYDQLGHGGNGTAAPLLGGFPICVLRAGNFLEKRQIGFRSGKSTLDAVVILVGMTGEGIEIRKDTLSDLSKAFDFADHNTLINQMEHCGT